MVLGILVVVSVNIIVDDAIIGDSSVHVVYGFTSRHLVERNHHL